MKEKILETYEDKKIYPQNVLMHTLSFCPWQLETESHV